MDPVERARDLLNRAWRVPPLTKEEGRELDVLWIQIDIDNNQALVRELADFYSRGSASISEMEMGDE